MRRVAEMVLAVVLVLGIGLGGVARASDAPAVACCAKPCCPRAHGDHRGVELTRARCCEGAAHEQAPSPAPVLLQLAAVHPLPAGVTVPAPLPTPVPRKARPLRRAERPPDHDYLEVCVLRL